MMITPFAKCANQLPVKAKEIKTKLKVIDKGCLEKYLDCRLSGLK
jgi:hypothetical protein